MSDRYQERSTSRLDHDVVALEEASVRVNLCAVIDSSGRGGNLFFLTLFDQHPQVISCPVVQYTYSYIMAEFGAATTIDAMAAHRFLTEVSYFRLIYNDPVGADGLLLMRMGGDIEAPLDRDRMRRIVDGYFASRRTVTRRELVAVALLAYGIARGMDLAQVRYVLIGDAISQRKELVKDGFSGEIVERILEDYPEAKLFRLVRDPRATFASPRHQFVNTLGNMYALKPGTFFQRLKTLISGKLEQDNGCVYLYWLLYLRQAEVTIRNKHRQHSKSFMTVKNEDLNLDFPPTMVRIAKWLGVDLLSEWETSDFVPTVIGRPWAGAGAYNNRYQQEVNGILKNDSNEVSRSVTGPNEYVTRRWRTRLSRREIELLERLFRREIEDYGYDVLHDDRSRSDLSCLLRTSVMPFEGELPTAAWLRQGFELGRHEAFKRFYYALAFIPFYIASRVVLFDFVLRKRFFDLSAQTLSTESGGVAANVNSSP